MTKTIIHVGYPKTATTWFVRSFYPNVKNANVIYSDDISFDISPDNEFFNIKYNNQIEEKELLILITNRFSGIVETRWENGQYRQFFLNHLKSEFPHASIIVFIRNQLDLMSSIYSYYLKRGGTLNVEKLFSPASLDNGNFFSFEFLNYVTFLKMYQEQFGKENVHIFIYEEFQQNNLGFLKHYSNELGMDVDLENLNYAKSNVKLRKRLGAFVRHTNYLMKKGPRPKDNIFDFPSVYKLINKRIEKLNRSSVWGKKMDSETTLGKELTDYIKEYCKESNKQLIDDFGLESIRKYRYPL